jgi:hypothetical protein
MNYDEDDGGREEKIRTVWRRKFSKPEIRE